MKKIYLIANWKMNPASLSEAQKLAKEVVGGFKKLKNRKSIEIVFCPPFPYLEAISHKLKAESYKLGAQNCHSEDLGAYTGEVSARMLKDLKCSFVIVGHSERREYFAESGELINQKLKSILKNKMTPVLAVGEHEGESLNILARQLKEALSGVSLAQIKNVIIAYEPIWAIGTGKAATSDDAMSARILIQKTLNELYSRKIAESAIIIYGGSTDSKNIASFVKDAGMQGALVGGSSIKSQEFIKMIKTLNENS